MKRSLLLFVVVVMFFSGSVSAKHEPAKNKDVCEHVRMIVQARVLKFLLLLDAPADDIAEQNRRDVVKYRCETDEDVEELTPPPSELKL